MPLIWKIVCYCFILVNMAHTACTYDPKDNSQSVNFLLPLVLNSVENHMVIHYIQTTHFVCTVTSKFLLMREIFNRDMNMQNGQTILFICLHILLNI